MPASSYFATIDYIFMGLYALVLVALGIYLKRRASESLEDYIMGGKKVPWWAMGISGMAQFLDLTGTALIVSFLFMLGPQGLLEVWSKKSLKAVVRLTLRPSLLLISRRCFRFWPSSRSQRWPHPCH